jgi:hypothetical protein
VLDSVYLIWYSLLRPIVMRSAKMIKTGDDAKYARIQLVIPKDVLAQVKAQAAAQRRNTSNMIVVLVEKALKDAETKPGQIVPLRRARSKRAA